MPAITDDEGLASLLSVCIRSSLQGTCCSVETVYIETTIPSFYYTKRTSPEMIARRDWTRDWWDQRRHEYELVSSAAVMEELMQAEQPQRDKMLKLLKGIRIVPVNLAITEIVDAY